jgi:hypothetical protein
LEVLAHGELARKEELALFDIAWKSESGLDEYVEAPTISGGTATLPPVKPGEPGAGLLHRLELVAMRRLAKWGSLLRKSSGRGAALLPAQHS